MRASISVQEKLAIKQEHRRVLASVSVDVDDCWAYLKTYNVPGWRSRATYLHTFLPRILDIFGEHEISATFFVVGEDVLRDENVDVFRTIGRAGHEYANHSYSHDPWLQHYSCDALENEIARGEEAIERVLGTRPLGFRAPGFTWSANLLHVLERRGYKYDASVLPTYVGPLARRMLYVQASMTDEARALRSGLFGSWRNGTLPNRPYFWQLSGDRRLLEMPVTVAPVIRTPIHLSYLQYLGQLSARLVEVYLESVLTMCAATGTTLSFLMHPLDLLGGDEVPALRNYPGMKPKSAVKQRLTTRVLDRLAARCRFVTVGEQADALRGSCKDVRTLTSWPALYERSDACDAP